GPPPARPARGQEHRDDDDADADPADNNPAPAWRWLHSVLRRREVQEKRQPGRYGESADPLSAADLDPEQDRQDSGQEYQLGGQDRLHLGQPAEVQGDGLEYEGHDHQREAEQPDPSP